jgi:transposase
MATTQRKGKPKAKPLPTIWEIPDDLWGRIKPILLKFWPAKPTGRRVANWRLVLNGIIFRMRSGCQWERLPRKFGPKSTVHGWFQRWCAGGVMKQIWEALVAACEELGGVQWEWQAADGWPGKARFGGKKGGEKPHGSREKRHQEECAGRGRRRTAGGGDRGGERPRLQVAERDDRGDRGGATTTHCKAATKHVSR